MNKMCIGYNESKYPKFKAQLILIRLVTSYKIFSILHKYPQVLIKKELEGEILLLQGDLDEAEATVNELNNEIPRQQDILEQVRSLFLSRI